MKKVFSFLIKYCNGIIDAIIDIIKRQRIKILSANCLLFFQGLYMSGHGLLDDLNMTLVSEVYKSRPSTNYYYIL